MRSVQIVFGFVLIVAGFAGATRLAKLFQASWIPRLSATTTASNTSPRMGLGVMVAPPRLGKASVVGHSGISGAAIAADTRSETFAFLSNFQWSALNTSFDNVVGLLRATSR